uniref:Uncharacterized protein n=1 Tax=Romanomermis culicivorax TaxID=13658 RepID=A0A915HVV7_ROMCU
MQSPYTKVILLAKHRYFGSLQEGGIFGYWEFNGCSPTLEMSNKICIE